MGILSWIFGCRDRDRAAPTDTRPAAAVSAVGAPAAADYTPADAYSGLRGQVLALKPQDLGLSGKQSVAVLMETGHQEAAVTLVAVVDGSTSLYFSNGGGIIGAGQHAPVRAASATFLAEVAAVADRLQPTTESPLPKRGRVRFYLLSGDGIRTAEASEQDLGRNRHELSPIFHSGHAVIAAVRENTPAAR